jgi:hypothetical protein
MRIFGPKRIENYILRCFVIVTLRETLIRFIIQVGKDGKQAACKERCDICTLCRTKIHRS